MAIPGNAARFERGPGCTERQRITNADIALTEINRAEQVCTRDAPVDPDFGRAFANESMVEERPRVTRDDSVPGQTIIAHDMQALIADCIAGDRMDLSVLFAGTYDDETIFIMRRNAR